MVRAVSPPSVRFEEARPPTAFSNSDIPSTQESVSAMLSARRMAIAPEPMMPPPSPITAAQGRPLARCHHYSPFPTAPLRTGRLPFNRSGSPVS